MSADRPQRLSDEELDRLARELSPAAPSPERIERSRDALLARAMAEETPVRRRPGKIPVLVALAALLLLTIGVTWQIAHREMASNGVVAGWMQLQHARILPGEGTRLEVQEAAKDERVRLKHGSISVQARKLQRGERFRVVTGDAEVEVRGTTFDVLARDDRLVSVHVYHGLVEVRPSGRPTVLLSPGQHWEAETGEGTAPSPAPKKTSRTKHKATPTSSSPDLAPPAPREPSAGTGATAGPVESEPKPGEIDPPLPPAKRVASAPRSSPAEQAFQRGWEALEHAPARAAYAFADAAEQAGEGALAEDARFWEAVALVRSESPRARAALVRFRDLYPGSARTGEVAAMLGWILLENGEIDAAKAQFERAMRDPVPAVRENGRQGLEAVAGSVPQPSP